MGRRLFPWLGAAIALYEAVEYFSKQGSPAGYGEGWVKTFDGRGNAVNYAGDQTAGRAGSYTWPENPTASAPSNYSLTGQASNPALSQGQFANNGSAQTINGVTYSVYRFVEAFVLPTSSTRWHWQGTNVWKKMVPRPVTQPVPFPKWQPAQLPTTFPIEEIPPSVAPSIDPFIYPPLQPRPEPEPIPFGLLPHRGLNPWRSPTEQSNAGDHPNQVRDPEFIPPGILLPSEIPLEAPRSDYKFYPDGSVGVAQRTRLNPHALRKPAAGEKELKVKSNAALMVGIKLFNGYSEVRDFVESVYSALPDKFKAKYKNTPFVKRFPDMNEMAQAIYDNLDQIDVEDAIMALIANEIEDRFYGAIGKKAAEVSARNRPLGNSRLGYQFLHSKIQKPNFRAYYDSQH